MQTPPADILNFPDHGTAFALAMVSSQREKLHAAGFRPVAVYNHDADHENAGKAPKGYAWSERARRNPPEAACCPAEADALNTGLLCDGLRAIDVDVDDSGTAEDIRAKVVQRFGAAPMRYRADSSRVLLLYRAAEGEPAKRIVAGLAGKVEILGRGQQFVAFGRHPQGARLEWCGGAPGEIEAAGLPTVSEADIDWLLAFVAPLLGAAPETPRSCVSAASRHGLIARDQAGVLEAMRAIPNDGPADWERWNKLGLALWGATDGSEEGREAFHAWSAPHATYDACATDARWDHYRKSPPTHAGAATIIAEAQRHGWRRATWGADVVAAPDEALPGAAGTGRELAITTPLAGLIETPAAEAGRLRGKLAQTTRGDIFPTLANLILILKGDPWLRGLVALDSFAARTMIARPPPVLDRTTPPAAGPYPRELNDNDATRILAFVQQSYCPAFDEGALTAALGAEAEDSAFHPIVRWLETLAWDRLPRLDTWLSRAFAAADSPYHAAAGAKLLVAAVRRVRHPGSKFDQLLVLQGGQGIGKSRALLALFGQDYFADRLPDNLAGKDAAIGMAGKWCIELGEITQLLRNDTETVKAFLSRSVDRYRPPYGRRSVDVPRQCVLIGTTNPGEYLRDPTGNRRFWPVACGPSVNVGWVAENRAQLWAEAAHREAEGESTWLDDESVRRASEDAQSDCMDEDVWTDKVLAYAASRTAMRAPDVLTSALSIPVAQQDRRAQMRVASILRAAGWTKQRAWDVATKRTEHQWCAPAGWVSAAAASRLAEIDAANATARFVAAVVR